MLDQFRIGKVPVSAITMDTCIATINSWVVEKSTGYVCVADVHSIMRARMDPDHMDSLSRAKMVTPDGAPLVVVGRMKGIDGLGRVCGPDLMLELMAAGIHLHTLHYLYGGHPSLASNLREFLVNKHPGVEIVGMEAPPFRPISDIEDEQTISRILSSGANIVWVGLGCPKQEAWMREHTDRLPGVTLIGVGAAFDFHSGRAMRAPKWMRSMGLEWLFRLIIDPMRLWRRYLVLAPQFVFMAAIDILAESTIFKRLLGSAGSNS